MADSQTRSGLPSRSSSCANDLHTDCGHLGAVVRGSAARGRVNAPVVLCVCDCREQVRELYAAELRSRGLAVPADQILDAYAAAIAGNRLPAGLPIYLLTEIGKDIGKFIKLLRNVKVFRDGE